MFDTFRANPSPATATPIVEVRRNSPFSLMMAGQANQALATALDLLADNLDNWSQVNGLTDSDKALIQGMIDAARPAPKAAPAPKPVAAPVVDVAALPALRGSEKQVAWAAQIRLQVADWLAGQADTTAIWVARVWSRISIQTDSRFWIDNFRSIRWGAPRADVWRSFGPWIGA